MAGLALASLGAATLSEAAHCSMLSLLLVASSHVLKEHLMLIVCIDALRVSSTQFSTGMKPSAYVRTHHACR